MFSLLVSTLASEDLRPQFDANLARATVKGRALFIGDSDVEYWAPGNTAAPNDSGSVLRGSNNVGVGGATCAEVKNWAPDALAKLAPSTVVLVCGENDLDGTSAVTEQAFADFKSIYELIAATGARTFTLSPKPEPGTTDLHEQYRAYAALVLAHARDEAQSPAASLVAIDSYGGFEDLGNPASLYHSDQLHLSPSGYARWAEWLGAAVDSTNLACFSWRSGACAEAAQGWPPAPPGPPSPPPFPPLAPASADGSSDGSADASPPASPDGGDASSDGGDAADSGAAHRRGLLPAALAAIGAIVVSLLSV